MFPGRRLLAEWFQRDSLRHLHRWHCSKFYLSFLNACCYGVIRSPFSTMNLSCPHQGCAVVCKSQHGRTYHFRTAHPKPNIRPVEARSKRVEHPHLTGMCCLFSSSNSYTDHTTRSPSLRLRRHLLATRRTTASQGARLRMGLGTLQQRGPIPASRPDISSCGTFDLEYQSSS